MSETFKNLSLALGGILVGAVFLYTTSLTNGQVITVTDDGIRPIDRQNVVVKTTETKEITTVDFSGTQSDLENEILPLLYKKRDAILTEIQKNEALLVQIRIEINKLPPRGNQVIGPSGNN